VEVAPALLVSGKDLRCVLEQLHGGEQEVVEVEGIGLVEPLAVAGGQSGDRPLVVVDGVLPQELDVEHLVLGPADRAEHGRRPKFPGQRQVLLAEDLLHQGLLIVCVVDDEATVDADCLAVAPEDARVERVERPGLDVAAGLADQADDPLAQLPGGPVREGDGEDLPGPNALDSDQVRDPVGKNPRLAAAGAGQDEQRAVGRGDRSGLLGVEVADDLLDPPLSRLDRRPGRGGIAGGALLGRQAVPRGVDRARDVVQPLRLPGGLDGSRFELGQGRPDALRSVV
jgi:hypothetical protein